MATPDAVAEANAECQTRAEPCAVGDALGTWLQVRGTRHTKFKEHLEAAKVDPTPAFARFADFDASVERSGGLIVCAYWDSAFAKAEGTEKLMPHHFADNRRHANEADGSRSAGELGRGRCSAAQGAPAPPIPFDEQQAQLGPRELYDRSTSATLCAANCIRTETLAGGRLVVHVLDRPLAPQANRPAVVLGAAAATAGPSNARSDAGTTAATAPSAAAAAVGAARARRPMLPGARRHARRPPPVRQHPARRGARRRRRVGERRAARRRGGDAARRARGAHAATAAAGARGTARARARCSCRWTTRRATATAAPTPMPRARTAPTATGSAAALLEASAGRYVLREGRRVDAVAVRAHFAAADGDGGARRRRCAWAPLRTSAFRWQSRAWTPRRTG